MSDDDVAWLACARVAECPDPAPISYEDKCSVCGEAVWVSRASLDDVAELSGMAPTLICLSCVRRIVDPRLRAEPIPPRTRSALSALGVSDAELDRIDRETRNMPAIEI